MLMPWTEWTSMPHAVQSKMNSLGPPRPESVYVGVPMDVGLGEMKRAVMLAATILVVSLFMPPGIASAQGRTYVSSNCTRFAIRPSQIVFTCADGGFYMTQGEWTTWHRYRAAGSALFHSNDCTPSCAGGTFHTMRGRIVLQGREPCPDAHRSRHVFTRATILLDGPLLGRLRYRAHLQCPI
jgi:hypothetical protein